MIQEISAEYGSKNIWPVGPGPPRGLEIIIIVKLRRTYHFPIRTQVETLYPVLGDLPSYYAASQPRSSLHVFYSWFVFVCPALTQQFVQQESVDTIMAHSVAHCGNETTNQMESFKHRGTPNPIAYHAFSSFFSIETAILWVSHCYPQLQTQIMSPTALLCCVPTLEPKWSCRKPVSTSN